MSRQRNHRCSPPVNEVDHLSKLSDELLCHILSFLPLREVLCVSVQNKKLHHAVQLHLNLRRMINFTTEMIHSCMPYKITDDVLMKLLRMCHRVETIYGLHPRQVEKRRQRGRRCLSIPGIIDALSSCKRLKGVEISNIRLLEAVMDNLPHVEIVGHFRNRDGQFPIAPQSFLHLPPLPRISCLHLTGIEVTQLPSMPQLGFLHLQWVRFIELHPFQHFSAPMLKTFTMKNCAGPTDALEYVPLAVALANAPNLRHMELVRVPLLGGLFQRVVEDHWKSKAFHKLANLITGTCRNLLENDIGFIIITSTNSLATLKLQPSLSKDSLMLSLKHCQARFLKMKQLHVGHVDEFPPKGGWSNEELMMEGLADVVEVSSPMTDMGMRVANQIFPSLEVLTINWSPHLLLPTSWFLSGENGFKNLQDLIIKKCHCLKLEDFERFLQALPSLECLVLEDVFLSPPRGCNHVGLSAGTGLGMSSAIINQNPLNLGNNGGGEIDVDAPNDNAADEQHAADDGNQNEQGKLLENYVSEDDERSIEKTSNSSWEREAKDGAPSRVSDFDKPGTSGIRASEPARSSNCREQASQASNEDIRQSMRKPQPNAKIVQPSTSGVAAWNSATSPENATAKDAKKLKRTRKGSCKKMCDKSTSTSDPFYNDEPADYATTIISDTLHLLTLVACGVTKAHITCPKLEHIEINACARFKSFDFQSAPNLSSLHVSECPQLDVERIVKGVAWLPAKRDRFVSLKVPAELSLTVVKELLADEPSLGYHFFIVQDHEPSDESRVPNKQCIRSWMKLFHNINYGLLKNKQSGHPKKSDKQKGAPTIWQQKVICDEGEYSLCTDVPWLQHLLPTRDNSRNAFSDAYLPESLGLDGEEHYLPMLKSSIADVKKNGPSLRPFTLGVYLYHGIKK